MKRILLLVACSLLTLFISFFLINGISLLHGVIYFGYPSILLAFLCWVFSLYRLVRCDGNFLKFLPRGYTAWATIAAVTGLVLLYEPFEFKIVFDEVLLSSSAQLMHFTRIAGLPQWANDNSGSYVFLGTVLDKRPLFFPFLLSLVHDFTGYRVGNVFFLNGVLSLVLVSLIYTISRIFTNRRAGLLAVLLAGTLPLLSIMGTSGHFEVLNLVMICMTFLLSYLYLRSPDETTLPPLAFSLILLSQVRYENTLYLLPYGILILLGWRKARRIILPWQVILCPLFLIVLTLHYRIILNQDAGFFQSGPKDRNLTFSVDYLADNLSSAFQFLFSIGQHQPNAYLLSVLGAASILLFILYIWKRSSVCSGSDPKVTTLFVFFLSILLLNLVIVFFNFGLFSEYVTTRLSLPLHLLFIFLIPFVAFRFRKSFVLVSIFVGLASAFVTILCVSPEVLRVRGIQAAIAFIGFLSLGFWIWKYAHSTFRGIAALIILYILTVSMPVGHAHRYSQRYISNDIIEKEISFIREKAKDGKILWISSGPYPAFLLQVNTASPLILKSNPRILSSYLDEGYYSAVYVSRRMQRIGVNQYECIEESDVLDPEVFQLETVEEINFNRDKRLTISRIVGVQIPAQEKGRAIQPEVPDAQ
jgi:hypothetical protein